MPSFTNPLEEAIHRALGLANERRHELATLEHLLLSLVDEPEAAGVMKACGVDLDALRTALTKFVDEELDTLVSDIEGSEAAPTTGFQRVIQRAAIHVQSSGRSEVTGANVLVAIFAIVLMLLFYVLVTFGKSNSPNLVSISASRIFLQQ